LNRGIYLQKEQFPKEETERFCSSFPPKQE
jgi:hypothetical protein